MQGALKDAVVIGAGVSGLTAAFKLKRAGLSVTLLEAKDRVGGVVTSVEQEGHLLELGPNSTLSKPAVRRLLADLGIEKETISPGENGKKRFLVVRTAKGPELVAAPMSLGAAIGTPIMSLPGKLRVFLEPFQARGSAEDESVYDFMKRRLGRECVERVIAPVLTGIWASDITRLSMRTALPVLWEFERGHGSLLRGALKRPRKKGEPRAAIISFAQGLTRLTEALKAALDQDEVQAAHAVQGIDFGAEIPSVRTEGGELKARRVIFAAGAAETASLIEGLDAETAGALRSVPYAPVGVLHLSYRRRAVAHPLDGFGFLWEPEKDRALLGALFSSSMFPNRAPADRHLVTALCGGAVNPHRADTNDPALQQEVIKQLEMLLGASEPPAVLKATYWERAIPNYPPGHHRLLERLDALERRLPVRFLGNWRQGISVADCITAAAALAEKITAEKS